MTTARAATSFVHGARGDERLLADLDAGHEHRPAADPAGAAQIGARRGAPSAGGGPSCGRSWSWRRAHEDIVLDDAVGREVDMRLDAHALADPHVVVDHRSAADDRARADPRPLADAGLVTDDRARPDVRAGEDDGLGADRRRLPRRRAARARRAARSSGAASVGGLPRIAPSWTTTPSPSTTPSWTTTCAPNVTPSPDRGRRAEDQARCGGVAHGGYPSARRGRRRPTPRRCAAPSSAWG